MKSSSTKCSIIYLGMNNKSFCCRLASCHTEVIEKNKDLFVFIDRRMAVGLQDDSEKKMAYDSISQGITSRNWELYGAVRSHLER